MLNCFLFSLLGYQSGDVAYLSSYGLVGNF